VILDAMRQRLAKIDRRLTITGLVILASSLLLIVGLVSIITALGDDNVHLPHQGSIEEILEEHEPGQPSEGSAPAAAEGPKPIRITIPRIGVNAPVISLGLDSDNIPQVPDSGSDVAWYTFSAPPGGGSNAVFSGHVDWYYWGMPGEGVFYHLRELEIGDEISLEMEDHSQLRYVVSGNVAVAYDDPNVVKVMGSTSKDVITLITCGGTWLRDYSNPIGGNYSHRVVVRAERALSLTAGYAEGGS
jgi:LPXTG-site transpeptidase (sortase) family protein